MVGAVTAGACGTDIVIGESDARVKVGACNKVPVDSPRNLDVQKKQRKNVVFAVHVRPLPCFDFIVNRNNILHH